LRAVTIFVFPAVIIVDNSPLEPQAGLLDFLAYNGQVREFQGCPIRLDQFHEIDIMEIELILIDLKSFLRETYAQIKKFLVALHLFFNLVCKDIILSNNNSRPIKMLGTRVFVCIS